MREHKRQHTVILNEMNVTWCVICIQINRITLHRIDVTIIFMFQPFLKWAPEIFNVNIHSLLCASTSACNWSTWKIERHKCGGKEKRQKTNDMKLKEKNKIIIITTTLEQRNCVSNNRISSIKFQSPMNGCDCERKNQ